MPITAPAPHETRSQCIARGAIGVSMISVGVGHLTTVREEFQALVPSWYPFDPDSAVVGSGILEIALGGAFLLAPRRRREIALAMAAFYVAVFPGNLSQYLEKRTAFGLDTDAKRLGRLFGQPALIAAALWAGGLPARS